MTIGCDENTSSIPGGGFSRAVAVMLLNEKCSSCAKLKGQKFLPRCVPSRTQLSPGLVAEAYNPSY